jgi:hypothetical protein
MDRERGGDVSTTGREIRVQQLAGPGVEGLETDPPLYHFDIDFDQVWRLIADPVGFLAELDLGPEQGIAPEGNVNVITTFAHEWTDHAWRRSGSDEGDQTHEAGSTTLRGCCYTSDDSLVCHKHSVD